MNNNSFKLPRLEVTVGDVSFLALVDSGSGKSLLRADIFHKIRNQVKVFSQHVPVDLYDINSGKLKTVGIATLEINVVGDKLLQEFIIVHTITEDCILGIDALFMHSFIFDGRERTIYRVKEPGQALPHSPLFVTIGKVAVQPHTVAIVDTALFTIRFPVIFLSRSFGPRNCPLICGWTHLSRQMNQGVYLGWLLSTSPIVLYYCPNSRSSDLLC